MHAHAVAKAASTYEHLDPALVGNERRILISELSGRSNVKALSAEYDLPDDDALMREILAEVVRLENEGFQLKLPKLLLHCWYNVVREALSRTLIVLNTMWK